MEFDSEINEDLKLDDNKLCDSCETDKKIVVKYCNECEINMCYICWSYHDKFKATKEHKVDTIEHKVQWICGKHEENIINKYCIQCNEVCCQNCSKESHVYHNIETPETMINHMNELEDYQKYLSKIKSDIIENAKNVCEQIEEHSQMLIEKIREKSSEMKERIEAGRDENINEIIEHEEQVRQAINQLRKVKNNFVKKRARSIKGELTGGADDTASEKAETIKNNVNYKYVVDFFKHLKIEYTLEARLSSACLVPDLGVSYNSMLSLKLLRRLSVPACRLMTVDQSSNRLFVISHGVCTFSLDNFHRTVLPDIPLYGDINDCIAFQKCILFSRVNENFINAYSFEHKTDGKLYTKLYVSRMNFIQPSHVVCIDGLQSSGSIFHVIHREAEAQPNSFTACLKLSFESDTPGELLLDCVLFDDLNLLGRYYSEETQTSRLKYIGIIRRASSVCISQQYPIRHVILKHDSRNVVMARDRENKVTVVSEGSKLVFFSDDFLPESKNVEFVKVGSIDLEDYNIEGPVKIACDEEKGRLFVMSKISQEILVFNYKVDCTEYAQSASNGIQS